MLGTPIIATSVTAAIVAALCLLLAALFAFLAIRGVRRGPSGAVAVFVGLVGVQMLGYAYFRAARTDSEILLGAQYLTALTILMAPAWIALVKAASGRPSAKVITAISAGAAFLVVLTPTRWMLHLPVIEWNRLGVSLHPTPGPLHPWHIVYTWAGMAYGGLLWLLEIRKRGRQATGVGGRVWPVLLVATIPTALSIYNLFHYIGLLGQGAPIEFVALGFVLTVATLLLEEVVSTHKHLEQEHGRVSRLNEEIEQSRERERQLALQNQKLLKEEIRFLREELESTRGTSRLIGNSEKMRELSGVIARVAPRESTVLILGETGSGKELVARELHALSDRAERPFIAINVAAMPETLLESELFGHVAGAFTGATKDRVGIFERAHGGTLFLDEIGEASPAVQMKLLRVLQEQVVTRIGGREDIPVDVRLIAATHRNLNDLQQEGRFREDLYYRLAVITLKVPPLRERREDIPLLAAHFLRRAAEEQKREFRGFSREALEALTRHNWPGNVRELANAIEHAAAMAEANLIRPEDLPPPLREGSSPGALKESILPLEATRLLQLVQDAPPLAELERRYLFHMIDTCGGNKSEAAKRLGIDQTTLYRRLKAYQSSKVAS